MRSRLSPVLAACMVTVTVSACGGSSPTKKDVIARGNAICASAIRSVRAVTPPPGAATSGRALSGYFQRLEPIVSQEVAQLRKLPRPATAKALLNRYIDSIAHAGDTYRRLTAAAQGDDPAGVATNLAALRSNPAQSLAQQYGMSQCAAASGTASP